MSTADYRQKEVTSASKKYVTDASTLLIKGAAILDYEVGDGGIPPTFQVRNPTSCDTPV